MTDKDYSIGYTAGLIALAIFITQLWLPTAISFLLAGVLRDEETAATWSVAAKILQSSHWTTILRTDSVRPHAVRRPVFLASLALPIATVLIAVSSVVTPIGLYDALEIGKREVGNFSYIRDSSAYFYGTSPRRGYNFSRQCSFRTNPAPCPFTNGTLVFSLSSTAASWDYPHNLTMEIPPVLREVYSSGTRGIGTTVSNFFDIEWRQLTMRNDDDQIVNQGSPYAVNMFRQVDSVALEDSVKLVEGLVVDTQTGGVGFRNHTVPQPPDRNVTWQEDLLFIEPVTTCVDTNLTFDYTEAERNFSSNGDGPTDYRLTDRGGFVNFNRTDFMSRTYPYYDNNTQANPDLRGRAYLAAMVNNFYTMVYLNVTNRGNSSTGVKSFQYLNSAMGKSFPLFTNSLTNHRAATFSNDYGSYLFVTEPGGNMKYPNPFNVTQDLPWFEGIPIICAHAAEGDIANITNIFVACGLVTGPPRRVDDGPSGIFDSGSKWTTPLYSCATAVRATIKTVAFSTDPSTNPARQSAESARGLTSFRVTNITAKEYPSPDAYPLWAVEDSGYTLSNIQPLWGLVSPAYPAANFPNISVVQQPSLYLVGLGSGGRFDNPTFATADNILGSDNLPAADFPFRVANTIYAGAGSLGGISSSEWPFDLVGRADMAVFNRWQALGATPDGASRMINLIWTDLAASAVVGTKGIATAPETEDAPTPVVHVHPIVHRVRYHYAYGIPAFVLVAVLGLVTLGALAVWAVGVSSLDKLRMRLQQLSAGRIFTIVLYPGESDFKMTPKEWSLMSGGKTVKFADGPGAGAGAVPVEEDALTTPGGAASEVGSVGTDGKVDFAEDVGPVYNEVYDGPQHGEYIALGPVSYGGR